MNRKPKRKRKRRNGSRKGEGPYDLGPEYSGPAKLGPHLHANFVRYGFADIVLHTVLKLEGDERLANVIESFLKESIQSFPPSLHQHGCFFAALVLGAVRDLDSGPVHHLAKVIDAVAADRRRQFREHGAQIALAECYAWSVKEMRKRLIGPPPWADPMPRKRDIVELCRQHPNWPTNDPVKYLYELMKKGEYDFSDGGNEPGPITLH